MSSTGSKASKTKLDPLTLSVDCLVHLCPRRPERSRSTVATPTSFGSYPEGLEHERNKVMGDQMQADEDFLKQFSDVPVAISIEHEVGKITLKLQNKRFTKELAQNNSAPLYPEERNFIEQTLGKNAISYKLDGAGFCKLFKALNNTKPPSEFYSSNQ